LEETKTLLKLYKNMMIILKI